MRGTDGVFVHPRALCEAENVGSGTRIWAFAHVMKGAIIGRDCNIGDHAFVEAGACIGDRVTIKNQVMVWDGVVVEDDVFIGPGATFTNDLWPRSPRMPLKAVAERYRDRAGWLLQSRVEKGATIGARSVILAGLKIGSYALVAAGGTVIRDVPDHALMAGVPARRIGWVCRCGARLSALREATWRCARCNEVFLEVNGERIERA